MELIDALAPSCCRLSAWVTLNVFINFWNKWALSPEGAAFEFPIFYSSCHMAMGLLTADNASGPSTAAGKGELR